MSIVTFVMDIGSPNVFHKSVTTDRVLAVHVIASRYFCKRNARNINVGLIR